MTSRWSLLGLTLVFDAFWLAAVVGRQQWTPLLLLLVLSLWCKQPRLVRDAVPLAAAGVLMDWLWLQGGFFRFDTTGLPWWLVVLWLGFASYLVLIQKWLRAWSPTTLVLAGALGGPLSYWAGMRLDAVSWPLETSLTLLLLALAWSGYAWLAGAWLSRGPRQR